MAVDTETKHEKKEMKIKKKKKKSLELAEKAEAPQKTPEAKNGVSEHPAEEKPEENVDVVTSSPEKKKKKKKKAEVTTQIEEPEAEEQENEEKKKKKKKKKQIEVPVEENPEAEEDSENEVMAEEAKEAEESSEDEVMAEEAKEAEESSEDENQSDDDDKEDAESEEEADEETEEKTPVKSGKRKRTEHAGLLYVGNMSFNTGEDELQKFFTSNGHYPESISIVSWKSGCSSGFGIAEFASEEAAQNAIDLDGETLDGRSLRLNVYTGKLNKVAGKSFGGEGQDASTDCLFVSNLSFATSEDNLYEAFEGCELVEIFKDRETGKSKGVGKIKFATKEAAAEALSKMNNEDVDGRNIKVRFFSADSGGGRGGGRGGRGGGRGRGRGGGRGFGGRGGRGRGRGFGGRGGGRGFGKKTTFDD